jgi:hypothetical protein
MKNDREQCETGGEYAVDGGGSADCQLNCLFSKARDACLPANEHLSLVRKEHYRDISSLQ